MQRLVGFGDLRTSNIVARIADEEVAHVAVGIHWFVDVCRKMDRAPGFAFRGLVDFLFPCPYILNTFLIIIKAYEDIKLSSLVTHRFVKRI